MKIQHALSHILLSGITATTLMGCDILTSDTTAITMLTRTPDVSSTTLPPQLAAMRTFQDALEPQSAVLTAVVKRPSLDAQDFEPVLGATVGLKFDTSQVDLCESPEADAAGTYRATTLEGDSCSSSTLLYVENATYTTEITVGADTSTIQFTAPPPVDPNNISLAPALSSAADRSGITMPSHPTNTALTVDWSADAAAGQRNGFITVFRVRLTDTGPAAALDANNWQADSKPVFDNLPREPRAMIDLLVQTPVSSVEIPATTFDKTGVYFVVLTAAELSTTTTKLALGSGALAGVGTVLSFWVE